MVKCDLPPVKMIAMADSVKWGPEVVELVRKYALQNAVEYDGKGEVGSVLGRILSERDDLRSSAKELISIVKTEVEAANSMAEKSGQEYIRRELSNISPEALNREKKQKNKGLKELPGKTENVVLRFAPNPNGPLSLGHSRGIVINSEYAKLYDGKVVLRFDDTDTRVKPPHPEAYEWIEEDFKWLSGRPADVVIRASERMPLYLDYADSLLEKGHLYVCRCSQEEFRSFREIGEDCPCRCKGCGENLADWELMKDGSFTEGSAVVRVKTEMNLPNPALRDWPAIRIQHKPHPMVGEQYKVWPLLDFQSAIEDHEQGVTHIIRGKDLMDSTRKQTFLYEKLGWDYPETLYWGRVKIHEFGGFSTSSMREEIEQGKFEGWDDPRLPTIMSFRRRGFDSKAIRDFWIDLGLTQKDVSISLQTMESFNSKIIDQKVERRSFVVDPKILEIGESEGPRTVLSPRHPEGTIEGSREFKINKRVVIQSSDAKNHLVRLKEFADVEIVGEIINIQSMDRSDDRPIIHWLPEEFTTPARLILPEGGSLKSLIGVIESSELVVGETYQLERVGFARLDSIDDGLATLVWLHE